MRIIYRHYPSFFFAHEDLNDCHRGAMEAKAASQLCPVLFLAYVFILLRAENVRSTVAVYIGIVNIRQTCQSVQLWNARGWPTLL